jgi:hypothetical protein
MLDKIDPSVLAIVIDKAYILFVSTKRNGCLPPYIKKMSSNGLEETLVDTGYGT